jgi:hypothetical protein
VVFIESETSFKIYNKWRRSEKELKYADPPMELAMLSSQESFTILKSKEHKNLPFAPTLNTLKLDDM